MKFIIDNIDEFVARQDYLTRQIAKIKKPFPFLDHYGIAWMADLDDLPPDFLDKISDEMFGVA